MSTPRRPSAGRRPARPAARAPRSSSRTTTSRSATQPVAGRPKRQEPAPRRGLLTPRAAVLALVIGALLASAALPLREYLAQRGEIAELEATQAAARERIAALEAERDRLQDPAYIAAQARKRLHFVMPGETAYVVLAPEELPSEQAEKAEAARSPWYSQVWGSVQQADRPRSAPR